MEVRGRVATREGQREGPGPKFSRGLRPSTPPSSPCETLGGEAKNSRPIFTFSFCAIYVPSYHITYHMTGGMHASDVCS